MKKYIVINKTTQQVFGKFDEHETAVQELLISLQNSGRTTEVFDFVVNEEEVQEIASYEEACDYLGLPKSDIAMCVSDKHNKALIALAKLFTIAEAWNKEDGFVPDFSNENQYKYFPWFEYNKDAAGFVFACTDWTAAYASAPVGSRLCFATRERAFDFGKQFEDLYNDFLLMR